MGMSASQIRYCMLQGRKSDIEFQGQQINQQRTTLATQSAAYNTQMLSLTVPTPPSTEEYTINTYEYEYNGQTCTIKGTNYMTEEYTIDNIKYPENTYIIDYVKKESKDVATRGLKYSVDRTIKQDANNNNKKEYTVTVGNKSYTLELTKDVVNTEISSINTSNLKNIAIAFLGATEEELKKEDYINSLKENFYYTALSDGNYAYFYKKELEDPVTSTVNSYAQSYIVSVQSVDEKGKMYGAKINWTDSGRMTSIQEYDASTGKYTNSYSLDVSTQSDDAAYEEAYNEYLYQKDRYNKEIDNINANLEVIQAQDKKLELQLTNLDTQENAIKTEMESVKKVVKDNIDKTFNLFG